MSDGLKSACERLRRHLRGVSKAADLLYLEAQGGDQDIKQAYDDIRAGERRASEALITLEHQANQS